MRNFVSVCACLATLLVSTPAPAVLRFCVNIVAERLGRTSAGVLFEKAARVSPAHEESLPFRFTHSRQGLRFVVREETTGVQLYVRGGNIVAEVQLGTDRLLTQEFSERVLLRSLERLEEISAEEAHQILSHFMDQFVVPKLLDPVVARISQSLQESAVKTEVHGGISLPFSTTWWPLFKKTEDGEGVMGFHYEGMVDTELRRIFALTGTNGSSTWMVAEVRLARGRIETLMFTQKGDEKRVFNWAEPLALFFEDRFTSNSTVVRWTNCLGGRHILAAELSEAQRLALDVDITEVSRAHLLGRDATRGFVPLDMVGLPVYLRGGFRRGEPALVLGQVRETTRGMGGGIPGTTLVRFRDGIESFLSTPTMTPAVPHLIEKGIDPATMEPFVFSEGDRVILKDNGKEYVIVSMGVVDLVMGAPQLRLSVRAVGGEDQKIRTEHASRFLPTHYYFPSPNSKEKKSD